MGFVIGLLTFVMVVDCLLLILLVLIQLPKKEAGAGLAFGGTATDALFGAGSGTVLTKITKYSAGTFFVLAMLLSITWSRYYNRNLAVFGSKLGTTTPAAVAPPAAPTAPPQATSTNAPMKLQAEDTNIPLKLTTNAPVIPTNPATTPTPPKQ